MSGLNWIKVADAAAELTLGPNNIGIVEADGKRMCIGRHGEKWVAFALKCPHAGGMMADGFFDAMGNVVCPLHRYKFNPENGRNTSGEGYYLRTWPVEIRETGVFVGMKPGFFSSLFQ
ncbi:MAG: Rieske (2Fe-2S) protein [Chitinophagaceae bacterium]